MRQHLQWLLILATCPALASTALAQQQRQLEQATPRGGSRGSTVEVLLQGMDMSQPQQILFSRGGITATDFQVLPPLEHPHGLHHGGKMVEQVRVKFQISPDCPLGEHPFRLRTSTTLGTLGTFWVGPFPTIVERERSVGENDTPEKAEAVALNSTVSGTIHEARKLDRDLYHVELAKGQTLAVEVESMRLCMMAYGGSEYDLMALVLDRDGKELARNDDNGLHVQDPLLSFVAPADGAYLVEIRQRIYRPHHWGDYRVHIGDFARPLAVYPPGGPVGQPLNVQRLGEASGTSSQVVDVPSTSGTFDFLPGPAGHQPPSPMKLRASTYPNVLEGDAEVTTAPSVPIALNGVIEAPEDLDSYRLPVKKGTSYRVRVFAGTLGSPLDARIRIKPVDGPIEVDADDSRMTDRDLFGLSRELQPRELLDPSVVFTPQRDGDYLLTVSDTRGMGGSTYVYRVEVEPVVDSVYSYVNSTAHDAFETNRVTGFIVPRGNRWTINVLLGQGQGSRFEGDLDLQAVGLPPGVTMEAPRVTPSMKVVPVQFMAAPDAIETATSIQILARPTAPGLSLLSGTRQGFSFVNQSGGHAFHSVTLDHFDLAVTQAAPFQIELVPPKVALVQGGELALDVKIHRREGFDEPIDILCEWLPNGLAGESAVTVSPGQAEARFAIHADGRATPGRFRVAMNATTTGGLVYCGVGRTRVSSGFVDVVVSEPYLTLNLRRGAIERGRQGELIAEVKHLKPLPGPVSATLKRLPRGIKMVGPPVRINAVDKQVAFPIEADVDALVGAYSGIVCELTVEEEGQAVRQQAGSGLLRVDPSRGKPMRHREPIALIGLGLAVMIGAGPDQPDTARPVSFKLDVMPVFFRAGCNSGGCHGAARGKDGFRLSLFGYDPDGDYFRLTEQVVGRRVDLARPEASLILAKATGQVSHTGGQLFKPESDYYKTLRTWVEGGALADLDDVPEPVAIELSPTRIVFDGNHRSSDTIVTARYSDGTSRDVTRLARFSSNNTTTATIDENGRIQGGRRGDTSVFARFSRFTVAAEVVVLPTDSTFVWPTDLVAKNPVDAWVFPRLQKLQLRPSEVCTDEQFLRRAFLDLIGLPPTLDDYHRFMNSTDGNKRSRLVDELMSRDEFADLWAARWGESLKIMGVGYTPHASDDKAAEVFSDWIRDQVARNVPLDQFVRAMLTSKGSNLVDGPVNLYTTVPQNVRFVPKDFAQDFAQLFTGIRIQCAECHNHPFDRWTMDDYYGLVSCFTGVTRKPGSEPREFTIYNDIAAPPSRHLLDDRPVPARVLGGRSSVPKGQDPRVALADWLVSRDNPYFARNLANRTWAHFFGRGIVEPVDDLRVSNPPSNGELLDGLAEHLSRSGFDHRSLIRLICTSRTYQTSIVPNATNGDDVRQFSRANLRRLRADVLLDAISEVTQVESRFDQFPAGTRAVQFYPRIGSPVPTAGSYFLETFGRSRRSTVCAAETRNEPTLSQTLHLIGGDAINAKLGEGKLIPALIRDQPGPEAIIEQLFIRALSRKPSSAEVQGLLKLVEGRPKERAAYDDIFWGLLTSSEFQFNH